MTTSNEITLILAQMETLLGQTTVLAAEVAKNYNNFTASPAFTGIPTAPTAPIGTNSNQLATTAYLDRLLAQPNGIATLDSNGLIPSSQLPPLALTTIYTVNSQAAMLALPADPGDICIRTDTNQTFVLTAEPASTLGNWTELLFAAPVTSVAGLIGAISASALTAALNPFVGASGSNGLQGLVPMPTAGQQTNYFLKASGAWAQPASTNLSDSAALARLASPAFTGTPTAPTAAQNDNSTQIATTAFYAGQAGAANPLMDGTVAVGSSLLFARQDHVHPTDTSRAPLTSPGLLGTPTAPTAAPGTNTTQISTTAFVTAAIGALTTGVSSVFGRSGAVVAQSGDYGVAQVTGAAPLASPTFTGTPAAPTPGSNISTTQIPTTAWVNTYFAALASPTFTGQIGFDGGTVTASTPVINAYQTWNNGAITFTGALLNITDTASASASLLLDLQIGGVSKFSVNKNGGAIGSGAATFSNFIFSSSTRMFAPSDGYLRLTNFAQTDFGLLQFGGTSSSFPALKRSGANFNLRLADDSANTDLYLSDIIMDAGGYANFGGTQGSAGYGLRDNGGTIEVKNNAGSWQSIAVGGVSSVFGRSGSVTAQLGDYSVGQITGAAPTAYPTFTGNVTLSTDGSILNFMGGSTAFFSNAANNSNFNIGHTSTGHLTATFNGGSTIFDLTSAGALLLPSNLALGVTGAGAVIYFGNNTGTSNVQAMGVNNSDNILYLYSRGSGIRVQSLANAMLLGITDTGLMQFLGVTSSFPALKRSGTALQSRLADDSAYAELQALNVRAETAFYFNSSSQIRSPADGVIQLSNSAVTGFARLNFGGGTTAFPSIKRNAATLYSRLADDSDWAFFYGATAAPGSNDNAFATTAFVMTALASVGSGFSTGDIKATIKTTADAGWVMCNDGTIGSASSGATTRANADTSALYTLLWNNVSNTYAPVTGGRGASAAADFAANKPIALTKMLGRALAAAGAGSGLTSRALGETQGLETVTLTSGTQASMSVSGSATITNPISPSIGTGSAGVGYAAGSDWYRQAPTISISGTASGSGGAHQNMQPTSFVNFMIKL